MKKMNKIALVVAGLALSTTALANNVIQFQGEVADQTCAVTIDGNASAPLVLLPTVPSSSLSAIGETAGQTPFTVGLTGCTATASATAPNVFLNMNHLS